MRTDAPVPAPAAWSHLGEIVECDENQLCVRVPRDAVAHASAELLEGLPVLDLSIQEEDVGTIIEHIQQGREESVQ